MKARGVDPRDISSESTADVYRVYFHDRDGASDEWRLSEAESVTAVIDWAERHADGRTYVLYAELSYPGEPRTLIQLAGADPNER